MFWGMQEAQTWPVRYSGWMGSLNSPGASALKRGPVLGFEDADKKITSKKRFSGET